MKNFIFLILITIIISSVLSIILNKLFKNNKYKYILPLLLFIASLYSFIVSKTTKESFLDLAYFLMFILFFAGFISSLITSLILDYRKNKNKL
ncbi:MAG: hypothetical protein N2448_11140 [Caloramator sp.]|nr:hypothetical protein [Caloramator sp.]